VPDDPAVDAASRRLGIDGTARKAETGARRPREPWKLRACIEKEEMAIRQGKTGEGIMLQA